ncbi:uncharacterized protein RCH25_019016 [Pelodytes ibericus]
MEPPLLLPCYVLCFCLFGLSTELLLHSSLVTFHNDTVLETEEKCKGIILLITNESSSLVCDGLWDVDSPLARVVCQESGCGKPEFTWTPQSPAPQFLEATQGMRCSGNESSVTDCESSGQTVQVCAPQSIAAITCKHNITLRPDNSSMRLSKGRSSCDGHVEVFKGGRWSPVCYTGLKDSDSQVFCQQMDCTAHRPAFSAVHKLRLTGAVMFQCQGNQTDPWECEQSMVNVCQSGLTTYLQCNRPRMEESWIVWTAIFFAMLMIILFCLMRVMKSWKRCVQSLYRKVRSCLSCASHTQERCRQRPKRHRNVYQKEPPSLVVQETNSPPTSPGVLQNPTEVNALLAPHGFRLNNTITPPPSYMHALKVLSRPLENTQTPPPSYLEALRVLSRPVLVHVHAAESHDEKEDLTALTAEEKDKNIQDY